MKKSSVSPRLGGLKDRLATAGHFAAYIAVRIFVCLLQALTIEACHRLASGLAWLATDVLRFREDVIDDNLRHAYPEMMPQARREMARQMWEHLFLMLAEIAHFPRKVHDTNWRDYIQFKNEAWMMRELFRNRPRVFVSGHYGNFELAGYTLGLFGFATFTVARPLDNPYLDRFINHFRALKGQYILPKQGSAAEADVLLAGHGTLGVLADQHAGPKGCWVNFFGRPASTHKAIAVFALTNDAPLMVGYARRVSKMAGVCPDFALAAKQGTVRSMVGTDPFACAFLSSKKKNSAIGQPLQYEMAMETLLEPATMPDSLKNVTALTQWYSDVLEQVVRVAPEQYWWVHRRWRDNRPQRRTIKQAA
jgi:Kdo2-lipid IVA lauroyltransferase/acyltransferase